VENLRIEWDLEADAAYLALTDILPGAAVENIHMIDRAGRLQRIYRNFARLEWAGLVRDSTRAVSARRGQVQTAAIADPFLANAAVLPVPVPASAMSAPRRAMALIIVRARPFRRPSGAT